MRCRVGSLRPSATKMTCQYNTRLAKERHTHMGDESIRGDRRRVDVIVVREVDTNGLAPGHVHHRRQNIKERVGRDRQRIELRRSLGTEAPNVHPIAHHHSITLINDLRLVITVGEEGNPLEVTLTTTLHHEALGRGSCRESGIAHEECTTLEVHWQSKEDRRRASITAQVRWLTLKAPTVQENLEFVLDSDEVMALREVREECVADSVENGIAGDVERGGERQGRRVEE